MNVELVILGKTGAIKDFLSTKRVMPGKRFYDPMAIPQDTTQCIHVEMVEENDRWVPFRCVNTAVLRRHGYHCEAHSVDLSVRRDRTRQVRADKDTEIVESIILADKRAIERDVSSLMRVVESIVSMDKRVIERDR